MDRLLCLHRQGFGEFIINIFVTAAGCRFYYLNPCWLGAAESRDGMPTKHSIAGEEKQCLHTTCKKTGIYTHM